MKLDEQKDLILNGIASGLELDDMFILAEVTSAQRELLMADEAFQARCKVEAKTLEKDLLNGLLQTITIQQDKGKDHGTIWLLGKMNPRFSDKPESGDKPGIINIRTQNVNVSDLATVEVRHNPEDEDKEEGTVEHMDGHVINTDGALLNTSPLHNGEKY